MTFKAWVKNVYIPELEARAASGGMLPEGETEIRRIIEELKTELES